jgi:hypothetical protein
VTAGGYKGASFWRADLHGAAQWANIKAATIGDFPGIVNNIVMDNPTATVGSWTSTRTYHNGTFYGDGNGTDTNSFGTNYLTRPRGTGAAHVQFTPNIVVEGDYDVYQWHPWLAAASTSVPHVIRHQGGTTTVSANQTTNAGNWSWLGRFYFAAGTGGSVQVLDSVAEPTKVAIADAIKLVFVPPASPPATPTGLLAAALGTSVIQLTWTDNATNETSYVVGRSLSSGGPYADLATLAANVTSHTDTNLLPGTTYHYVVRGVNPAGASPNSAPASATTAPLVPEPPVIIIHPCDRAVLPGQPAAFSVLASGSPPLHYQWYFNGVPMVGATTEDFNLPSVQQTNAGWYSVQVTNMYGVCLSSNALLGLTLVTAAGDDTFAQLSVLPGASNVVALAAGAWHSVALRDDGGLVAWGNNWDGQCDVPATGSPVVAVAAGGYHNLALTAEGRALAWGADYYQQCAVPAGLRDVVAVAAGTWHSLALQRDGRVAAWGDNSAGQTAVPSGLSNVIAIAAGGNHSLALKRDGTVVAWGENTDAQGRWAGQSVVPAGLSSVVTIAAGEYHSLALKADGTVVGWGDNAQQQAQPPAGLAGVTGLAAGGTHSLALQADGTVVGWGNNWSGQGLVPPGIVAAAVAAGGYHTLALLDDGPRVGRMFRPVRRGPAFGVLIQSQMRGLYRLEYRDDWSGSGWVTADALPGNGAVLQLSDPNATRHQRFYRVRRE